MDRQIAEKWESFETIVKVEASRIEGEKISKEIRYYISDALFDDATYFDKLTRGHWGIENHLTDRRPCGI